MMAGNDTEAEPKHAHVVSTDPATLFSLITHLNFPWFFTFFVDPTIYVQNALFYAE